MAKRKNKNRKLSECLAEILTLPVSGEELLFLSELGMKEKDADNKMLIMAKLVKKAEQGDISAIREVRSIMQETESTDRGLLTEIIEAVKNVG